MNGLLDIIKVTGTCKRCGKVECDYDDYEELGIE